MSENVVVAIDGPAGAGKSTVAKALAHALQLKYLDTGAMFRAVTSLALSSGIDVHDEFAVGAVAENMILVMENGLVVADGTDVTTDIRSKAVTSAVSTVAANSRVRAISELWSFRTLSSRCISPLHLACVPSGGYPKQGETLMKLNAPLPKEI